MLYHIILLLLSFKLSKKVLGAGTRYNSANWLAQLIRHPAHCALHSGQTQIAHMGTGPFHKRVLENYILLPKGYSQNPQHNFPRFIELFSNFVYLTATHTADRSIVLAQKYPNFTLKVRSNGPLVLHEPRFKLY